jgi:hypothetical protein
VSLGVAAFAILEADADLRAVLRARGPWSFGTDTRRF